ncbi:rifin, partial [Plasmodium gaboni]
KIAKKNKKDYKKSKKTLGHTLTEWNILSNIDMYEWIPFSSKEAKINCNIKNMKHALTKVGYIGPNKFASLGNKDGKDSIDMDQLFSSIMSSSNAFIQRYMGDDITSSGNSLKKQKGLLSLGLYALWEFFEHVVIPIAAALIFGSDDNVHRCEDKDQEKCKCICENKKKSCCASADGGKCACNCVCAGESTGGATCACKCAGVCTGEGVATCTCKCAHGNGFNEMVHQIMERGQVFVDAFFAVYIIASIMLILYYVLKYYREVKMGKKEKYMKILQE